VLIWKYGVFDVQKNDVDSRKPWLVTIVKTWLQNMKLQNSENKLNSKKANGLGLIENLRAILCILRIKRVNLKIWCVWRAKKWCRFSKTVIGHARKNLTPKHEITKFRKQVELEKSKWSGSNWKLASDFMHIQDKTC